MDVKHHLRKDRFVEKMHPGMHAWESQVGWDKALESAEMVLT